MTETQRKLSNIARRKRSVLSRLDSAYRLGYGDGYEEQMKARIRDEQARRHEREQCPICRNRRLQ